MGEVGVFLFGCSNGIEEGCISFFCVNFMYKFFMYEYFLFVKLYDCYFLR